MKNTFILLLLALSFIACKQKNQAQRNQTIIDSIRQEKIYIAQATSFIHKFNHQEPIILGDKVNKNDDFSCLEHLKKDTITFTKAEITFITSQSKSPLIKKWTKELIPNAKLIEGDTITQIFKNYNKGWAYFYKHIGKAYHSFSAPIFIRNYQYCIFYSSFSCGYLCGEGELTLYKKDGTTWKKIKTYCDWIS